MSDQPTLLGDRIGKALAVIGITDESVSALIRRPCKCRERRMFLNQLDLWARRTLAGKIKDAGSYLDKILIDYKDKLDEMEEKK